MTTEMHRLTTSYRHSSNSTRATSTGSSSAKPKLSRAKYYSAAPSSSVAEYRLRPRRGSLRRPEEEKKKCVLDGQSSKFRCGICFDDKAVRDRFKEGKCNHPFCTHCISKHVASKLRQNILKVTCPNPNCHVELKAKYLHTILPNEVIDRWERAKVESLIVGSQKTYCPFKDCSALLVNDGGKVVTSAECPSCHRLFCAQCRVPWHGGKTCKDFQKTKRLRAEKELDNKLLKLAKENKWQKCPQCVMFVQRRGGCEHIFCRCGCNFCYNCGKNWNFGHLCKKPPST